VLAAAKGCAVIVHAVNPPGYRNWGQLVLPMLDNTIAAAIAEGATIVLPGTVYNYGPDAFPASGDLLAEDAPQRPLTRKGAIRVELEARLERASTQGARVIIVRAGDFFGPRAGNNWFSQGLVKPGQPVRSVLYPARPASATSGPTCPTWRAPCCNCWPCAPHCPRLHAFTWPATGTTTAAR